MSTALSGIGAEMVGGRWNSPGTRVVYAALSPELAAFEVLVHLDATLAPTSMLLLKIRIPARIKARRVTLRQLKGDWRRYPSTESTRKLGDRWLARGEPLALRVPSALMPESENVLLNPAHAAIKSVVVASHRPFSFDPRFFAQ